MKLRLQLCHQTAKDLRPRLRFWLSLDLHLFLSLHFIIHFPKFFITYYVTKVQSCSRASKLNHRIYDSNSECNIF